MGFLDRGNSSLPISSLLLGRKIQLTAVVDETPFLADFSLFESCCQLDILSSLLFINLHLTEHFENVNDAIRQVRII